MDIVVKEDCSQHQTSLGYESPLSVSIFPLLFIKFQKKSWFKLWEKEKCVSLLACLACSDINQNVSLEKRNKITIKSNYKYNIKFLSKSILLLFQNSFVSVCFWFQNKTKGMCLMTIVKSTSTKETNTIFFYLDYVCEDEWFWFHL